MIAEAPANIKRKMGRAVKNFSGARHAVAITAIVKKVSHTKKNKVVESGALATMSAEFLFREMIPFKGNGVVNLKFETGGCLYENKTVVEFTILKCPDVVSKIESDGDSVKFQLSSDSNTLSPRLKIFGERVSKPLDS